MTSATEAELAVLYINAREAVYIRIILEEIGHKQPPTPMQTDNAMAEAVINGKIAPKRTKAMDMRFHWLRDRECQQQFKFYWRPGKPNHADYWTSDYLYHLLELVNNDIYMRENDRENDADQDILHQFTLPSVTKLSVLNSNQYVRYKN
jgi:hypothetical protein